MNQLTISALSTLSPQEVAEHIESHGLDLSRVEQIDFAGLQLLIAIYLESSEKFASFVRGTLPANVIGNILEEGGALSAPSNDGQPDLAPLWSQICE